MDKKLYLIMNSGSVDYIFENEEERDKKYAECNERESHYEVTHYYYGKKTMTRGEYVCEHLCHTRMQRFDNMFTVAKRDKKTKEQFEKDYTESMRYDCSKCPFKNYSPFVKEMEAKNEQ